MWPNRSSERGASRFTQRQIERHRRLAPVGYLYVRCNILALTVFITL